MKTPICDFVRDYAQKKVTRLHMPGHKGVSLIGCEGLDITEINGADSLYEADGIIAESEANASSLFGCKTFYSGMAMGFDIISAETVLFLKRVHSDIELVCVLPFAGQEDGYSDLWKERYFNILKIASKYSFSSYSISLTVIG